MLSTDFNKSFDELIDLQKNLAILKQKQNLRNTLKIIGIGFLLYRNIQSEIENNLANRKTVLDRILSETKSRVDYFETEILKIKNSSTFLLSERITYLLCLLQEFEKKLAYLKRLDNERQSVLSNSLTKIVEFQSFISNYNFALEKKQLTEQLSKLKNQVLQAETEFNSVYKGNNYFSKRDLYEWREKWVSLVRKIEEYTAKIGFEVNFGESLRFVISAFRYGEKWVELRNKEYVENEIIGFSDFFSTVEKNPLTLEQKKAIVTDEENNLVVAGAGTGKTSTIVGKAGYLIKI
jgi:hypothetical protein